MCEWAGGRNRTQLPPCCRTTALTCVTGTPLRPRPHHATPSTQHAARGARRHLPRPRLHQVIPLHIATTYSAGVSHAGPFALQYACCWNDGAPPNPATALPSPLTFYVTSCYVTALCLAGLECFMICVTHLAGRQPVWVGAEGVQRLVPLQGVLDALRQHLIALGHNGRDLACVIQQVGWG